MASVCLAGGEHMCMLVLACWLVAGTAHLNMLRCSSSSSSSSSSDSSGCSRVSHVCVLVLKKPQCHLPASYAGLCRQLLQQTCHQLGLSGPMLKPV